MERNEFHLRWERDEKHALIEKLGSLYDEKTWEEAVKRYDEALLDQPDNPEYLFCYGYLMQIKAKKMLQKAAKCFEDGLNSKRLDEEFAWIADKLNYQLISVRSSLDEIGKTIQFYKKKLLESPDNPQLYCFLTKCYLHAGQVSEAEKTVKAGLKLFPDHAALVYYEGEVLSRQGFAEEALQAWERSAVLNPQLIDGRFSKAFLLEREQRLEEALAEWKRIAVFLERYGFDDQYPQGEIRRLEQAIAKLRHN